MRSLYLLATLFALSLLGCGSGGGPALYNVKGTVTLDGTPIPKANLLLEDATGETKSYFFDVVNGEFSGEVTAGKKKVNIQASRKSKNKMMPTADGSGTEPAIEQYLPKRYNAATILEAEIKESGDNTLTFDLESN